MDQRPKFRQTEPDVPGHQSSSELRQPDLVRRRQTKPCCMACRRPGFAFMRERQRRCAASEHVTPHWDEMGQRRPGHFRLWTRARIGTVEARSTSLDDSVSIPAAAAPARGERGTGSHIRRTFVSLRGGGGYALRHIWTLEVVAPRPIRCGAAGS
jgi:hypothetical protein